MLKCIAPLFKNRTSLQAGNPHHGLTGPLHNAAIPYTQRPNAPRQTSIVLFVCFAAIILRPYLFVDGSLSHFRQRIACGRGYFFALGAPGRVIGKSTLMAAWSE
jgi:hypothetical protein